MTKITLYHNPRCSKSRQALALLEEAGANVEIVRYLETPPSVHQLKKLQTALAAAPRDFMRRGEAIYKDLDLDRPDLRDKDLLTAITEHPKLLERPIAVSGDTAVIGRPPENILKILK